MTNFAASNILHIKWQFTQCGYLSTHYFSRPRTHNLSIVGLTRYE